MSDKITHCPYCKSSFLGDVASNASLHEKIGRYELALNMYADKDNWMTSVGGGYNHCEVGCRIAIKALEVEDDN